MSSANFFFCYDQPEHLFSFCQSGALRGQVLKSSSTPSDDSDTGCSPGRAETGAVADTAPEDSRPITTPATLLFFSLSDKQLPAPRVGEQWLVDRRGAVRIEMWKDIFAHPLEGQHDVAVGNAAGLLKADDLIHPCFLNDL